MTRHCSTKDFFRQMSIALLARYFQRRGLLGNPNYAPRKESQPRDLVSI